VKPREHIKVCGVEVPRPEKFPVSFDEMLRCLIPKVETKSERRKRFFDFLQDIDSGRLEENDNLVRVGRLSFKDASDCLEKMIQETYNKTDYGLLGQHFLRWWPEYLSKKRAKSGVRGGRPKKVLARQKKHLK
jgi:hypothetical protein